MNLLVSGFYNQDSFDSQIEMSPSVPDEKGMAPAGQTESDPRAVPSEVTTESRLLDHFSPLFEIEDCFHSP